MDTLTGGSDGDRRDSYRIIVEPGDARLEGLPASTGVQVHDMSASGVGVQVLDGDLAVLRGVPVSLRLAQAPSFTVRLRFARQAGGSGGPVTVGYHFQGLGRSELVALSRFLTRRYAVHASRGVLAPSSEDTTFEGSWAIRQMIVSRLLKGRAPLRLHDGEGRPLLTLTAQRLERHRGREVLAVRGEFDPSLAPTVGACSTFSFPGFNAVNVFSAEVVEVTAEEVAIELPSVVRQTGFRRSPRTRLLDEGRVVLVARHPCFRHTELRRSVLEVGAGGLSIAAAVDDGLCPGQRLGPVRLELPAGPCVAEAVLRGIERLGPGRCIYGVELLRFGSDLDARRWKEFVFSVLHRRLRLGCAVDVADYWRVLEESGYVELLPGARRQAAERRFRRAWSDCAGQPETGRFFLLDQGESPAAGIATNRVYPRTWLVHQLGIDRVIRRCDRAAFLDVAREMYSGMLYLLGHMAELEYFLSYFDADKPWNDFIYGDFLLRYPDQERFIYDQFELYEVDLSVEGAEDLFQGIPVFLVTDQLWARLAARLAETEPRMVIEALALGQKEIDLRSFARWSADHGLERDREAFVALTGGKPSCAMIAETGAEGVNIFGLLDRCWLVELQPGATRRAEVVAALITAARQYYQRRGRSRFLLFDELGLDEEGLVASGARRQARGIRYLARATILPAWLNYLGQILEMSAADEGDRI